MWIAGFPPAKQDFQKTKGSFFCYYFKSSSEDSSQVFRIKTRLSTLVIGYWNKTVSEWIFSRIKLKGKLLYFCGEQNVYGLFSDLSIVYLLSPVWSLWEMRDCLTSVTGSRQAQDHVCLCMFIAPVSWYTRNKKSNVNWSPLWLNI